jgi:hypothetical protein
MTLTVEKEAQIFVIFEKLPKVNNCPLAESSTNLVQGCQMVYFQTKNTNFGNFVMVLQWKMLVYFMDICSFSQQACILNGHLIYFVVIWYILWSFGISCGHLVYFVVI